MPPYNQQSNPYEFITNPQKPSRRAPKLGNSMGARIAIVASILVLLIVGYIVLSSFLGRESKAQVDRLIEVGETQSELVRISALAEKQAKGTEAKNLAANTSLSMQSSQQDLKKLLNGRGVGSKGLDKRFAAAKNAKTDTTLTEASRNNRFDETYTTVINKEVADYQKLLNSAFESGTVNEKKSLQTLFQNAKLLSEASGSQQATN
jgi:hypothetical protein